MLLGKITLTKIRQRVILYGWVTENESLPKSSLGGKALVFQPSLMCPERPAVQNMSNT